MVDTQQQDPPLKLINARQRRLLSKSKLKGVIFHDCGGVFSPGRERILRVLAALSF
jgi:hypothetical protein